jgi:hypothetical protein
VSIDSRLAASYTTATVVVGHAFSNKISLARTNKSCCTGTEKAESETKKKKQAWLAGWEPKCKRFPGRFD